MVHELEGIGNKINEYKEQKLLAEKSKLIDERNEERFQRIINSKVKWTEVRKKLDLSVENIFYSKRSINYDGEGNAGEYFSYKLNEYIDYESELEFKIIEILEKSIFKWRNYY